MSESNPLPFDKENEITFTLDLSDAVDTFGSATDDAAEFLAKVEEKLEEHPLVIVWWPIEGQRNTYGVQSHRSVKEMMALMSCHIIVIED